jgi:predicted metal-binding membrane protein
MRTATGSRALALPRTAEAWPAAVLVVVAAACWVVTANRMEGMDMGPGTELGVVGWFAGVWVAMMAAMMLPSLAPMALTYARAAAGTAAGRAAATVLFGAGFLLPWVVTGLGAYALIEGVRGLEIGFLAWDEAGPYVAGGVIAAAALYELTAAKAVCLRHCREPELLLDRFRPGALGTLRHGIEHGGFCVGCCWALMAALFAVGVMSITWMVVIAAVIAIEKLLPQGEIANIGTAALLAVLAIAVAFFPEQVPALTVPEDMSHNQDMSHMSR